MFAFLRLCEFCTHRLSSASSRTALHGNGKLATCHHSTLRPGAQGLTALPAPCCLHQQGCISDPEYVLFAIWTLSQIVSGGSSSELTDPQKQKFPIWPIPITSLGITHTISMESAKPKLCMEPSRMLIQHQSNSTMYNDQ